MQESRVLRRGFRVGEPIEAGNTEANGIASRATIHVIAQRQDYFEQFLKLLAASHLFGGFQDGNDFGLHLTDALSKLLFIEERIEALLVMADPVHQLTFLLEYAH